MVRAKQLLRRRRRGSPGAVPGSLDVDPAAPKPTITAYVYGRDSFEELTIADPHKVRGLRGTAPVVWVNVDGLGDEDTLLTLANTFGIHPLSMEDVVHVGQRPKAEAFDEYLFVVLPMASADGLASTEQVSLFLGDGFVLTFQERPGDCLDPVRERLRQGEGRVRHAGADYLAYALIDTVVDRYFPILDAYVERLEAFEDDVMVGNPEDVHIVAYKSRQELRAFRRSAVPLRDALGMLTRPDMPHVGAATRVYFRDCHDHAVQLAEAVDAARDTATGLMELHLSMANQRMGEVMKVLTIIATIFIPLSFVAGFYGMNFDPRASSWNMPELRWAYGYPFALGLMVAITGGLLWYFRRRGLIGRGSG